MAIERGGALHRRLVLNIALALVIAVLIALVVFEPGREEPAPQPSLTTQNSEQVRRIEIVRKDGPTLVLARSGERWDITAPHALVANAAQVETVLDLLKAPSFARYPAAGFDLAAAGLAEPTVTVRYDDLTVQMGDTDPLDGRRYVQVGDQVHLIEAGHHAALTADLSAFVALKLAAPGTRLTAIQLPELHLLRADEGPWRIEPERADVSADAIAQWVQHWQDASALWIDEYQAAATQGAIELALQAPDTKIRYEIVSREPDLVLARPEVGLQYHLAADAGERLLRLPEPETTPAPEPAAPMQPGTASEPSPPQSAAPESASAADGAAQVHSEASSTGADGGANHPASLPAESAPESRSESGSDRALP